MNTAQEKKFHSEVAEWLAHALRQEAEVRFQDAVIKIVIPREAFENRFGLFLWRLQQLIDERYPNRSADIAILIRDAASRFEHVFKIWKTL